MIARRQLLRSFAGLSAAVALTALAPMTPSADHDEVVTVLDRRNRSDRTSRLVARAGEAAVRVLSNMRPSAEAVAVAPTLEDAYLLALASTPHDS